ncbi:hypothetical protein SSX86_031450 [Deinandra increscens subsp. villosa]|uniref:TIR domain-containing protein n=1 Tax=Deinandra increscens subsp. villosa TaxID=3103831 RepID=A0AAP0C5I2_9ASTR
MTSSSQSCNCDVFLSFRGEDTRKTFVDHLYSALADRKVHTYKDDEKLPRGESIRPSLFKAIKESQIAVIIFSKNYADSSWCLEELAYIMKCKNKRGLFVMPIFYDVVPSEVRKQQGEFGRGFGKQEVENVNKIESWRKALVDASEIAGWEPKNIANGHEAKVIKEIVDTISDKLFSVNSCVDEDLVGMSTRLQQLEDQLDIGSGGVLMVGIWGVGGGGKTTLASSLCMKISRHFQGHCIIDNIREESSKHGLKRLQEKFLSTLLKTEMKLQSVEEGKHMIRSRLNHSNVLILLDDVDDCKQLDTLVGSRNWFGSGSRVIITTRDEHLLRTHKVDLVCPVMLLSHDEAIMLFNKHAYNKSEPINHYDRLSLRVISYAAGLPLALKVLGSFLYDKNEKEWLSSLSRLKDIPEMEIVEMLKISYDGLKTVEKELFLDIACFFRGKSIKSTDDRSDDATEIFEACGYHPDIGIKVLRQKALITVVDGRFDMHDLVQEMGHYIVRGERPNNPETHSRVWKDEEIENLCLGDGIMANDKVEVIRHVHDFPPIAHLPLFFKIVSSMKKLRWLSLNLYRHDENAKGPNFLSNELQYIRWYYYPRTPFPDNFQPMKLVVLKLCHSLQKQLWKGYKHLPQLKVLQLQHMENLLSTPNFDGLPCLQKLTLYECEELKEIHQSLGKHTNLEDVDVSFCRKLRMFPTIVHMGKLETLEITYCHRSLEFPEIKSNMESLVNLYVGNMRVDALLSSIGDKCSNLISLNLIDCFYLKNKEVNFYGLKHLEEFKIHGSNRLKKKLDHVWISWLIDCYRSQLSKFLLRLVLPQLTHSLRKLDLHGCRLKDGEIPSDIGDLFNLQELDLGRNDFTRLDFSLSQLTRLKILTLTCCKWLVELPKLPSHIVILRADYCRSLTTLGDFYTNCKWLCQVSLSRGGVVIDGSRLLQSMRAMFEGNALRTHSMILNLEGLEIAKGFTPPLVRGSRCRLELPENWSNDFSGFLMCAVGAYEDSYWCHLINMEQVPMGNKSEEDVVWEASDNDKRTLVWYVSFASFRHTIWWNSGYTGVLFTLEHAGRSFSGFGVKLVERKSGIGLSDTLTTQEEYEFSNYAPNFNIVRDSQNVLKIAFPSKYEPGAELYAL